MDREVVWRSETPHATIITTAVRGCLHRTAFVLDDGYVSAPICSPSKDSARQIHYLAKHWMLDGAVDVDHPLYGRLHRQYASMLRDVRAANTPAVGPLGMDGAA